ncbi:hypothetical protein C1645_835892 [Glomus cerebriforme]|uniref:Crinkler effector protein N-terminal domain-containing protein n=1 Tax=Glomus cerebriforme TaxID=658196 RepID=A0A397SBJ5_9GLOM|nr:hypothetical protein C1645_835892 [Glomus cerebriforme]
MSNIIKLNCLISGDDLNDIVTLPISMDEQVDSLRYTIKERWSNRLKNIDHGKLILYKVDNKDLGEVIKYCKDGRNSKLGKHLSPLDTLRENFEVQPNKKSIHIIVYY